MKCITLTPNEKNLGTCVRQLSEGNIIGVPTETVYGLAGNALQYESVRKIFSIKGRPLIDPLIVHFSSSEEARKYIYAPVEFDQLSTAFWPGPLTLVLKKRSNIPDIVTAGLDSVAIRIPSNSIFKSLLKQLDFPLAAPSANPFGYVSPTCAQHVKHTLGDKIGFILDDGPCHHGLESTILDMRNPANPTILRHGPVEVSAIESALGVKVTVRSDRTNKNQAQDSPGLLSKHYSPNTCVKLFEPRSNPRIEVTEKCAIIYQSKRKEMQTKLGPAVNVYWLSDDGNPEVCAKQLYSLLQKVDTYGFNQLWVEKSSDSKLGIAINDRLMRAASDI